MASFTRIATILVALPIWAGMMAAPAAAATSGFRLVDGPADAAGCHSLQVWKDNALLKTIPADDGAPTVHCARNIHAAVLPNGNLVFDWAKHEAYSSIPYLDTELYGSGGTVATTQRLRVFSCDFRFEGRYGWKRVGKTVFLSYTCDTNSLIVATRGVTASTFVLPGSTPGAGKRADGQTFPLFQVVSSRVVYAATGNAGRELYASNGTENGSYLVRDIHPGPRGSGIRQLYGFHSNAVFNADDGTGRRQWVTDGTRQGTHPS